MMLNNQSIQERIRIFGQRIGLTSDNAICKKCAFNDATIIGKLDKLKTAPQLDTLAKFAKGLGVSIEDLIHERTEVDRDLSRLIKQMNEYEKVQMVVFAKTLLAEKNEKERQKAA